MKNKLLILVFAIGVCGFSLQAQTLSPSVISSSGGYFTSTDNILTQGFQQPEDYFVGITETPESTGEVLIYPNPSNGNFTLSYYNYNTSNNVIKLYNLVGQVVLTKTVAQFNGLNTVNFDLSNLNQGIYLLEINTVNAKGEAEIEVHKINLIY